MMRRAYLTFAALVVLGGVASGAEAPAGPGTPPAPQAGGPTPPAPPSPPPAPPAPPPVSSSAKMPKTTEFIRFVPAGEDMRINFNANVNPDCSSLGKIYTRVVAKPEHGEISFVYKGGFGYFTPTSLRDRCNTVEIPGLETHYTSAPDFLGEDVVEVLYIYPGGTADIQRYLIQVK